MDWSLIMGRGGVQKGEGGGSSEVLPLQKGGQQKIQTHDFPIL